MTDEIVVQPDLVPEPQPRRGKRSIVIGAVAAVFALLALGLWLSYRPAPGQLQGMVDAHEIRAASKVTGRIAEFHVEEGQTVEAGQLLYTIDSPEVAAKSQQAKGALAAAEAVEAKTLDGTRSEDVRAAEAQWLRAKTAADLASKTFDRTQRLFGEGVLTGQKRDETETNAIAAREAARAARAQYDLALAGARPEDRRAASGQAEQARGVVAEVSAALGETQITAPVGGEVGRRLVQVGEIAPQGFPVFVITEVSKPWVAVYVREDQFTGMTMGATLTGTVPALEGRHVQFRVTYIAPAGDFATWRATRQSSGFDIKSFEVHLTPVKPVEGLRPGMSVLFDWPQ